MMVKSSVLNFNHYVNGAGVGPISCKYSTDASMSYWVCRQNCTVSRQFSIFYLDVQCSLHGEDLLNFESGAAEYW